MRGFVLSVLLIAPMLAGCLSGADSENVPVQGDAKALATYSTIPDGAEYIAIDGGMALVWKDQERPFAATFELPEGATMVRFVADPGADQAVSVAMSNQETGRRRCNQQSVINLAEALTGPRSCSSIAVIDDPGTKWAVRTGTGNNLPEVRIEFYHTPLDGPAALVDWNKLSKATHELQPTTSQRISSFDGTELWVEVTLPEGDGPWPTIIAASPYNGLSYRIGDSWSGPEDRGTPAMWTYWTQDWAKRGYATINVDVRGFGLSGGCVEVWSLNEQLDQKFIVEWATEQAWSDGHVGFYGQSYVATTPLAAAVHQAEGLDAIIMVAPVVDSYFDWHYGGVPNGESGLSPAAYRAATDVPATPPQDPEGAQDWSTDLPTILQYSATGACDPTLEPRANDPRAIHGEFYDERDFGAKASDIKAAVLYTQGFEDANVKSAMIGDIWNDIESPKLGLFGHWLHQHPARMDAEVLFLGWMDQFVKGIDLGITEAYPETVVTVDAATSRGDDSWPPITDSYVEWGLKFDQGIFSNNAGNGQGTIVLVPQNTPSPATTAGFVQTDPENTIILEAKANGDIYLVAPELVMEISLEGENAMVYAQLDEIMANGESRILTWGMKNLALRPDYDTYTPIIPDFRFTDTLPFRPTEHIIADGSTIRLTLRGVDASTDSFLGTAAPQPGQLTFYGAGTTIVFAGINSEDYHPIGLTELP